jgi:signal transduction histidine kinase
MAKASISLADEAFSPAQPVDTDSKKSSIPALLTVITNNPLIVLALFLMISMTVTFYVSWQHKVELEQSSAIRAAAAYSKAVTSTRSFYSSHIVPRAKEAGATVSHRYRDQEGTIPFPATMSIDLGLAITDNGEGTNYRIYSGYPFPWRRDRKIDKFERQALAALIADPDNPIIRFDQTKTGKVLRYTTAIVMTKGCVGCHNTGKDSPKTDWRTGDVRGVQRVTIPLPDNRSFAFMEMGLMAFISGLALLLMWMMTMRLQVSLKRTRELAALSDQRNAELVLAKSAAENANAAKTRFLATMSHELRTPLNSIIGFADVLTNADKNKQIQQNVSEYATNILASGHHLLDLINGILDMSKIESGMFELEEGSVSLQETINTSVQLLSQRAEAEGLTIEIGSPAELPMILADRKAMRQILLNLLSNAIKFTEPGGCITIRGGQNGNGVWIAVADTGIGIPADQLGRIFEPFTQADNSAARRHEGSGLGLSITKALVELHSGWLLLDSVVDQGTRVTIHFPASRIVC